MAPTGSFLFLWLLVGGFAITIVHGVPLNKTDTDLTQKTDLTKQSASPAAQPSQNTTTTQIPLRPAEENAVIPDEQPETTPKSEQIQDTTKATTEKVEKPSTKLERPVIVQATESPLQNATETETTEHPTTEIPTPEDHPLRRPIIKVIEIEEIIVKRPRPRPPPLGYVLSSTFPLSKIYGTFPWRVISLDRDDRYEQQRPSQDDRISPFTFPRFPQSSSSSGVVEYETENTRNLP